MSDYVTPGDVSVTVDRELADREGLDSAPVIAGTSDCSTPAEMPEGTVATAPPLIDPDDYLVVDDEESPRVAYWRKLVSYQTGALVDASDIIMHLKNDLAGRQALLDNMSMMDDQMTAEYMKTWDLVKVQRREKIWGRPVVQPPLEPHRMVRKHVRYFIGFVLAVVVMRYFYVMFSDVARIVSGKCHE